MKRIITIGIIAVIILFPQISFAGPVIFGGDDLTEHGFRDGGGANASGWFYIQTAIASLLADVTRSGPFTVTIAALGSSDPGAGVFTAGDAGGAINSVANVLGLSLSFFDGDLSIESFFDDLGAGAINPKILWIAGTDAANDINFLEGQALTNNANAIRDFVASGGAVMAHGFGINAYGWLPTLLPGVLEEPGCESEGAALTAEGQTALPGLADSNIDDTVGLCHGHFEQDINGLSVYAFDGDELMYIIGGDLDCRALGVDCPDVVKTAIPEPATMTLFGLGLAGIAVFRRYRPILSFCS